MRKKLAKFRSTPANTLAFAKIFSINFFYYFLHDCFSDFNHDFVLWQRLRSRWKVSGLTHRAAASESDSPTLNNTLANGIRLPLLSESESVCVWIQLTIQLETGSRETLVHTTSKTTELSTTLPERKLFQSSHKFHSTPSLSLRTRIDKRREEVIFPVQTDMTTTTTTGGWCGVVRKEANKIMNIPRVELLPTGAFGADDVRAFENP